MIASLKGVIGHIDAKYAIIDVGGVGYKVFLTADALHGLNYPARIRFRAQHPLHGA